MADLDPKNYITVDAVEFNKSWDDHLEDFDDYDEPQGFSMMRIDFAARSSGKHDSEFGNIYFHFINPATGEYEWYNTTAKMVGLPTQSRLSPPTADIKDTKLQFRDGINAYGEHTAIYTITKDGVSTEYDVGLMLRRACAAFRYHVESVTEEFSKVKKKFTKNKSNVELRTRFKELEKYAKFASKPITTPYRTETKDGELMDRPQISIKMRFDNDTKAPKYALYEFVNKEDGFDKNVIPAMLRIPSESDPEEFKEIPITQGNIHEFIRSNSKIMGKFSMNTWCKSGTYMSFMMEFVGNMIVKRSAPRALIAPGFTDDEKSAFAELNRSEEMDDDNKNDEGTAQDDDKDNDDGDGVSAEELASAISALE